MILLLLPLAFLPMIIVFVWIRNTERFNRESWVSLLFVFSWGALIATALSLVLENAAAPVIRNFLLLSVIVAPVIEEFAKPLGLFVIRRRIGEVEDGFIYGAVAGIGFAATENLLYGLQYMDAGWVVLLSLFYLRTIGSGFLHAAATAVTGYGYSVKRHQKRSLLSIVPFYFLAVLVHGLFNLFAFSALTVHQILGVVMAVLFAVTLMFFVRIKIMTLDKKAVTLEGSSVDSVDQIDRSG